jgi:hypothetical protein
MFNKSPPVIHILGQINPLHAPPPILFLKKSYVIFARTPRSSLWCFSLEFSYKNLVRNSPLSSPVPRMLHGHPSHRPWFGHSNNFRSQILAGTNLELYEYICNLFYVHRWFLNILRTNSDYLEWASCTTRFNVKKTLHSDHRVYLCVPYGSHSKQRLFP